MILNLLLSIQMICKMFTKIEEYNIGKKRKILIVFADMIADMINKKRHVLLFLLHNHILRFQKML